jgi:hypothetical protein
MDIALVSRRGYFADENGHHAAGEEYVLDGRRFAILGWSDPRVEPTVTVGRHTSGSLHILELRATGYPVRVGVCGANPCPVGSGVASVAMPVAVELLDGEAVGEPLRTQFDTWWAMPSYTAVRRCPDPRP